MCSIKFYFQGVCEFLKTIVSKLQEDCSIALNVIIEILMIGFRKSPQPAGMLLFKEVILNLNWMVKLFVFYNSTYFLDNNNVWTTRSFYSNY